MKEEQLIRNMKMLIQSKEELNEVMKKLMFDYCKQEGLVSASLEIKNFAWKNAARTHLGLVI